MATAIAEVEVLPTLAENEEVIARGLATFVEVGRALSSIRDQHQYVDRGYDSFEEYCKAQWDIGVRQAERNIATSVIASLCSPTRASGVLSQKAVEPLVKVLNERGEGAVMDAWSRIVERHKGDGPITGREVSAFLSHGANYNKPGWLELIGIVGDALARAESGLSKCEAALTREPNAKFRERAAEYATAAEQIAARLRAL